MGEHRLKKRANGRLGQLQALCMRLGVESWRLRFESALPPRKPGGQGVDMYSVVEGKGLQVITLGVTAGDTEAVNFFSELFACTGPALGGSILLLDLYDTLTLLEKNWDDPALRAELSQKVAAIRKSFASSDSTN